MARVWKRDADGWGAVPIGELDVTLTEVEDGRWVLVWDPARPFRLNGWKLTSGLAVLEDRDEIRFDGHLWFFSTETLAKVEPVVASGSKRCPRCRRSFVDDDLGVRCPRCDVWYHQHDDFLCWTYAEDCALCGQPTDLESGYRWTPEEL